MCRYKGSVFVGDKFERGGGKVKTQVHHHIKM